MKPQARVTRKRLRTLAQTKNARENEKHEKADAYGSVDEDQKPAARHARHEGGKHRSQPQARGEGDQEEAWKVGYGANEPHRVTQGAEHVPACKQGEEDPRRPNHSSELVGLHAEGSPNPFSPSRRAQVAFLAQGVALCHWTRSSASR
jgi:hypothetical protein